MPPRMPPRVRGLTRGSYVGRLQKCVADRENAALGDEELVQTRLLIERSNGPASSSFTTRGLNRSAKLGTCSFSFSLTTLRVVTPGD